jgi:hypothetical protein
VAASYSQWPVQADIQLLLTSTNVTLRVTGGSIAERFNRAIAEVTQEVAKETHQQFLADTSDTTRIYDGSGTSELEVDPMVSFTGAVIIGLQSDPGFTLAGIQLANELNRPQTRLITATGSAPAWTTDGVFVAYHQVFPVGRQNVKVTGKFGYAASIPQDLWEGVCQECAFRMTQEVLFRPTGRVAEQKAGDAMTRYSLDRATITGWHERYRQAIDRYKRRPGRKLRNMKAAMI